MFCDVTALSGLFLCRLCSMIVIAPSGHFCVTGRLCSVIVTALSVLFFCVSGRLCL